MEPCLVVLLHHHDTFLEEMFQDLTTGLLWNQHHCRLVTRGKSALHDFTKIQGSKGESVGL